MDLFGGSVVRFGCRRVIRRGTGFELDVEQDGPIT